MVGPAERNENIKKLRELIREVRICMLTTLDDETQRLRSRPMVTQDADFDGDLYFFTKASAPKVDEVQHERDVNISYTRPDDNLYISVSGKGRLVRDKNRMEEYWQPTLKAWFPQGLDDPDLALLKVEVEQAEYWEAPHGAIVQLTGFIKGLTTGERADIGENEKMQLK